MAFQSLNGYRWRCRIPFDDCGICRLCGFSIADRPGLAVGLIGGMLATTAGAGILGGIIAGFLSGYVVKGLNATIKLPASLTFLNRF